MESRIIHWEIPWVQFSFFGVDVFMILMHVYFISPPLWLESEGVVFVHLLLCVVFDKSNIICILKWFALHWGIAKCPIRYALWTMFFLLKTFLFLSKMKNTYTACFTAPDNCFARHCTIYLNTRHATAHESLFNKNSLLPTLVFT